MSVSTATGLHTQVAGIVNKITASMSNDNNTAPVPQTHKAAVLHKVGEAFKVEERPTTKPGADEILIQVKAIALNPVDIAQMAAGFHMSNLPGVIGSDVGGIVAAVGSNVSAFEPGARVTAFAPAFDLEGLADYGAFQEYVLVPSAYAAEIPHFMSFDEASILPMAVQTSMAGWYSIGTPIKANYSLEEKRGMLVWGGSSSIGTAAVQSAKLMGFTVYAIASSKHHQYVRSLGAHKVFDYKDDDVVAKIVSAAKEDGVKLETAYDAVGSQQQILDVLSQCKAAGSTAKVASAIPLGDNDPKAEGVEVSFVLAPTDKQERRSWSTWVFNTWLQEKLASKDFVPSPSIEVIPGGLEAVNGGLDKLKQGVSATKLVIEI